MTEQVSESESSVTLKSTSYIGEELRAARIARSMEIGEIARRLNLEEYVVEGLEQANYEGLPEMAYIRGYLLSYIRLMDLPESLMKHFDDVHPLHVALVSPTAKDRSACSGDGWVKCITWGLVLVLLIVVGIWGVEQYTQYIEKSSPSIDTQQVGPGESADPVVADKIEEQAEPQPEPFVIDEVPEEDVTASGEPVEESIEGLSTDDVMSAEAVMPGEVEPAGDAMTDAATEEVTEAVTPAEVSEAESALAMPVLVMNFLDASWVSISDGNDKVLRTGTFNKGQSITLEHEGELRLIIGRAQNIELTYAGEPVDLSSYASIARFRLGTPAE